MLLAPTLLVVTIRLFDVYGVPAPEFRMALSAASAALERAGLAAQWIDCVPPARTERCEATLAPGELILRIRRAPRDGSTPDVLGSAILNRTTGEGAIATIYADRITELSRAAHVEAGVVIGHAMAHELGHLLLARGTHSTRGLMRALWTSAELKRDLPGDWTFSRDEVEHIQHRSGHRSAGNFAALPRAGN